MLILPMRPLSFILLVPTAEPAVVTAVMWEMFHGMAAYEVLMNAQIGHGALDFHGSHCAASTADLQLTALMHAVVCEIFCCMAAYESLRDAQTAPEGLDVDNRHCAGSHC